MTNQSDPVKVVPVAISVLIAGALVLGIGFWAGNRDRSRPAGPPALVVTSSPRVRANQPFTIEFETRAALRLSESGWAADGLHLHALVDGVELMPGATEVRGVRPGVFAWHIPRRLEPGTHSLRLVWAGTNHRNVTAGSSSEIVITADRE